MAGHEHDIELKAINTMRTLSIDAIEKANSGHPGLPMGAAPMAYTLWAKFLKHNPDHPAWFNRDRFVLSAGHGSMLLYSLLHLHGYDLTMEDIEAFRQWGSQTPGHPEFGHTPGVEATTGPLGQGIGMAVGMALAEKHLAARYNRSGHHMIDHHTYVLCGDGDLMEGISYEAASLAGHLQLGKLIVLYDSNDISLDGDLHRSFSEDIQKRFESYGWQYLRVEDGTNLTSIADAIAQGKAEQQQPTMIEVKTTIGHGSPNMGGTNEVHGKPLGAEEIKLVKENYAWPHEAFHVPADVRAHYQQLKEEGIKEEQSWQEAFEAYKQAYPELAKELQLAIEGKLPDGWDQNMPTFEIGEKIATRAASGKVLNAMAKKVPYFLGGSADLAGSNNTLIAEEESFDRHHPAGRNLWFGVREHAMGAALNGMMLHGGLKAYVGTFFVFSDYLRPAIRLAALQQLPVTYVFTHDSIAVGEDGPTHEPVEQLPSLRVLPNLDVIRPADANETIAAWKLALTSEKTPTALVLTRQGLPVLAETKDSYEKVKRGAYILSDSTAEPECILLATGSEVSLALEAKKQLEAEGKHVRVVSMPSWYRFEKQDEAYKEQILPSAVKKRVAIEMAVPFGWERYVGEEGITIGIHTFGASAPGAKVMEEYGFNIDNVVSQVQAIL